MWGTIGCYQHSVLTCAFYVDACHRGSKKSSEVAGELLTTFKGFHLQQQCSKPAVTIKHWCELSRTLLVSNYANSIQETQHPVFLLTSMDLMVFRLWSSLPTTLVHPCSAMTPRKTESGEKNPSKPRITYNEYLGIALMCDLGQAGSPLFGASLSHHVSFE